MMVIKSIDLETVCGITSVLPKNTQPEFAFAGKSNVGKSSLINALMNRKSFARISSEPGKTQTINYYHINDSLYFVDLPGYGYAKVSKNLKAQWGKMIEKYLHTSKMLKRVFLLIDHRHDPSADDRMMFEWILSNGFTPVVVLTKADKLSKNQRFKMRSSIAKALKIDGEGRALGVSVPMVSFSSVTKEGREELYTLIEQDMEEQVKEGAL